MWGLTQVELAMLLGLEDRSCVSRLENGKRAPSGEDALACQILFGLTPSAMFPHTYALVEEEVMRKAYQLHLAVNNTTSLSALRKREFLAHILARAKKRFGAKEHDVATK